MRIDADEKLLSILGEPLDWLEQQGNLDPNVVLVRFEQHFS